MTASAWIFEGVCWNIFLMLYNAMGQSLRLFWAACALGDSQDDSGDSMEKLARWQHEWHITAEAEAKQAIATGFANSMTETWQSNRATISMM